MKKKKQNDYLFYIILFLVIIIALFLAFFPFIKDITKDSDSKYKIITTGTLEYGDVAIEIIPLGFNNEIFEFKLSANTHSVDLSKYNLKEIITLQYEGKTIKPIEAVKMSGHHSSGSITFEINHEPKEFKLIITSMSLLQERIYEWN